MPLNKEWTMSADDERQMQIADARKRVKEDAAARKRAKENAARAPQAAPADTRLDRLIEMSVEQERRMRRIETRMCKLADALGVDVFDL